MNSGMIALTIDHEQEVDGRWIAEVLELPGVLAYGETRGEAVARAQALALRVLADQLEQDVAKPELVSVSFEQR
jgi:predicted RNase H-like HicB family nuclease